MARTATAPQAMVPIPLRVAVTAPIRQAFDDFEIRGQGGFQQLLRSLCERVNKQPVIALTPEELRRIANYATNYGEGGYQQRLRLLLASWVSQHMSELVGR